MENRTEGQTRINNERKYENSLLPMWHIMLGVSAFAYSLFLTTNMTRNIWTTLPMTWGVFLLYIGMLVHAKDVFGKRKGFAYFLSFAGFFLFVFADFFVCMNGITINLH